MFVVYDKSFSLGSFHTVTKASKYMVVDLETGKEKLVSGSAILKNLSEDFTNKVPCRYVNIKNIAGTFVDMSDEGLQKRKSAKSVVKIKFRPDGSILSSDDLNFKFEINPLNSWIIVHINDFVLPIGVEPSKTVEKIATNELSLAGYEYLFNATVCIGEASPVFIQDYKSLMFELYIYEITDSYVELDLYAKNNGRLNREEVHKLGHIRLEDERLSIDGVYYSSSLSDVVKSLISNSKMPNVYAFNRYSILSNYYMCPVKFNGIEFTSSEAAYQALKFKDKATQLKFVGLTPNECKSLARSMTPRSNWDDIKIDIMYEIVYAKAVQNEDFRKALLNTGDLVLIEDTTGWHDKIWGRCCCPKCIKEPYENNLGKVLMRVRSQFRR